MLWTAIKRGGGLALILAIFGGAAIYAWAGQSQRLDDFASGETAQARVISLEKSERFQSGSTSTNFFVTYSVDGTVSRESVNGEFFDSIRQGETIPVAVIAGNPPAYRIETGRLEESSIWALAIGVVLFALAGWLGWVGLRAARREQRLREQGQAAKAEVVELVASVVPKVRFAWNDSAGLRHEAHRPRHPSLGEIAIGDGIDIVYDPANLGSAVLAVELGKPVTA